jgi:hypothetical protein
MAVSFAALVFRPLEVSDRALSQGFAVALAGWDLASPHLSIAPLAGIPGYAVAFFSTGKRGDEGEAFDLACELFEEEIPPALGVLDAALPSARVYAVTYAEGIFHDDVWRYDAEGYERHFVHEGEGAPEACVETPDGAEEVALEGDDEAAVRAHRGTAFLSAELGAPALPALVAALWATERRVPVRLVDPAAVAEETRRLVATLHRSEGRGAFAAPPHGEAPPPASYLAFARTYDWADPADPGDLYRELSIGAIEGTLHLHREADLARALEGSAKGLYPIARLDGSALGGGGRAATLALAEDGEHLRLVRPGAPDVEAGPTFGELLRYLALGWSKRSDAEEDMIEALMLRAKLRAEEGR